MLRYQKKRDENPTNFGPKFLCEGGLKTVKFYFSIKSSLTFYDFVMRKKQHQTIAFYHFNCFYIYCRLFSAVFFDLVLPGFPVVREIL